LKRQAAVRRAFKEISCRWVIPGHGPKQFESGLRDYQARQLRQASPEIPGNGNSARVCLGLFAAAEPELIQQLGISKERVEQPDLYLRIPAHKESIFRSTVDHKGMPASAALQVWLDVSNRGETLN
jgi:hypothetical protein